MSSEDRKQKRLKVLEELQNDAQEVYGFYNENKEIKVLDKGFVRLVDSMGNDQSIVQMARVSYGAGTKTVSEDEGLIRYLVRNRHTSPLEGVQFKFHVKAPIFVIRQWQRHRMWSYNELSGRYSEMKDEFYVPDESVVTKQNPDNKQGGTNELVPFNAPVNSVDENCWLDSFEIEQECIRSNYEHYLQSGMRRELARINLPLSQYTEMYATVDLHNLFHFLKLRQDKHAQYEIRVYADALLELIRQIVPIAVQAYEDYILNSITFSKKELIELKNILSNSGAESILENSREKSEFLEKIKLIDSL